MKELPSLKAVENISGVVAIAIISDRIPEELRIKISEKFAVEDWKLDDTMKLLKNQLEARERSLVISGSKEQLTECSPEGYYSAKAMQIGTVMERRHSTNTSQGGSYNNKSKSRQQRDFNFKNNNNGGMNRSVPSVFCKGEHSSSKCRNVTNINIRYDIVRRDNRCFVCLKTNHRSKDCPFTYYCIKCQRRHNIALCTQFDSSNDNNYRPSRRQEAAKRREFFNNIVHSEQFAIQVGVTSEDGDQNGAFSTTTNAVGTKSIQPNEILL